MTISGPRLTRTAESDVRPPRNAGPAFAFPWRDSKVKRLRTLIAAFTAIGLATVCGIGESAPNCQLVKIGEWPVRLERNQVIVDGAINGQKIGILLDTGSTWSLVLRPMAARLGLTLKEVRGARFFGVGGETNVETARIDEFRIGETVRKDWTVVAVGERQIGPNTAFILGEDFFSRADVEFDLAHKMVRLFIPKECGGSSLAYWAGGGAGEVAIETSSGASSKILLTVEINGHPVQAQLDSGSGRSVLDKNVAARLGVTPETVGAVAVGSSGGLGRNSVQEWAGPFASFAIGDEAIKDTTIRFADLWKDDIVSAAGRAPQRMSGMPDMLLGVDFLRSHRVLISHSQHKMYFTYAGGPVFSIERPMGAATEPAKDAGRQAEVGK
jgi:predicted aspartyl protease